MQILHKQLKSNNGIFSSSLLNDFEFSYWYQVQEFAEFGKPSALPHQDVLNLSPMAMKVTEKIQGWKKSVKRWVTEAPLILLSTIWQTNWYKDSTIFLYNQDIYRYKYTNVYKNIYVYLEYIERWSCLWFMSATFPFIHRIWIQSHLKENPQVLQFWDNACFVETYPSNNFPGLEIF